jgi:hypothetical protein
MGQNEKPSPGTHVAAVLRKQHGIQGQEMQLKLRQDLHGLAQATMGFAIVVLVVTGIGGTIYKVMSPDGWIAQAFGRSLSVGFAALGSLCMIGALAWYSRGWSAPATGSRVSNAIVYMFAAAGIIYLAKLWLQGSF